MDNTYKILYSNINEFDDLLIDKKECDLNFLIHNNPHFNL